MTAPADNCVRCDKRVVLTLDAGGTSFRFGAMRGGEEIIETLHTPSHGHDLALCLETIAGGFSRALALCPAAPVAISFAFPGPAATPSGVIGDLANLPAFRGGVALGPMLEDRFQLPVFINNDGDMFAYGEAIAGVLPWVNDQLARAGHPRRFHNLVGLTLGTGFGAGLVSRGVLHQGDNGMAGEIWLVRHKLASEMNAEEGASIRAVRTAYARAAGIASADAPDPKTIAEIAAGAAVGRQGAALEAFRQLGEVVGDALADVLTLLDGIAVIGGGLAGAAEFFMPALLAEVNGHYLAPDGSRFRRLTQEVHDLDDPRGLAAFLAHDVRMLPVPGSTRAIPYQHRRFTGVAVSRLGTSRAIATGAYAYALHELDSRAAA